MIQSESTTSNETNTTSITLEKAIITRCRNPAFGDFQCMNAIGIANCIKKIDGYVGVKAPKDVATAIVNRIPTNTLITAVTVAVSYY